MRVSRLKTWVWMSMFITVCSAHVSQARFLEGSLRHKEPRSRLSSPPCATLGTHFINAFKLGKHSYTFSLSEKNGILYTAQGGHIDTPHLRKLADWTAYLACRIQESIQNNETGFEYRMWEPSRHYVTWTYPETWSTLSKVEREEATRDIAIALGQHLAFTAATWHEILTWHGYRGIGVWPEFQSAFSWEDNYSNLLGCHIAGAALSDPDLEFDEAMTREIEAVIDSLGGQTKRVARQASAAMRGTWFEGDVIFLKIFKRNFDIGLTDGYITPWIVTCLNKFGLATAQPASIPLPSMEPLHRVGFEFNLEIEPREFEKNKILRIVYPNPKTAQKRINPDIHFKPIMEAILRAATERYGPGVQQAYCAGNPAPVSYVTLDLSRKDTSQNSNHAYWETMSAGSYKPMVRIQ
ncbi:MAG: DUF4056 domain-containing protein [Phycisphaerae bacterium]|nr:DUF4056 domain-containing protein [Phycisphaerae bacterium]